MKALRVRRLLLFPRFHASVKDSLESSPPEVRALQALVLRVCFLMMMVATDMRQLLEAFKGADQLLRERVVTRGSGHHLGRYEPTPS